MATLIDLRRRIRSVRNSQKITQAMKTVSTAKFRKAHRSVVGGRPWWTGLPELARRFAAWAEESSHPLLERRPERKIDVVVVAADKGLAGAFSSALLARAAAFLEARSAAGADVRLTVFGRKAALFFRKTRYPKGFVRSERTDKMTRDEVRAVAEDLMRRYALRRTDAVYILSNAFKSILAPRAAEVRVLPVEPPAPEECRPDAAPLWDPDAPDLLRSLLPLYVESELHQALLESQAAEEAARMMAMENATRNAEELITDLTLFLNKVRQASITRELLEIMTAVNALSQQD